MNKHAIALATLRHKVSPVSKEHLSKMGKKASKRFDKMTKEEKQKKFSELSKLRWKKYYEKEEFNINQGI